jgi:putative FmdB family regulatory protein
VPIYEYECRKCHHRFERIQKFSDPLVKKCPSCRGGRVDKLLSPPAVHFKGTGWYVTDYARKSSGKKDEERDGKKDGKKDGKEGDKKASSGDSSTKSATTKKDEKKS